MAITKELDHTLRAQERLTQQFKNKPNVLKLINVITSEVQILEDELFNIATITSIDDSEGTQLDNIGGLLGINRNGRTDAEYRTAIRGQIFVNRSDGSESYLSSAFTLIAGASNFTIDEPSPATARFTIDVDDFDPSVVSNLNTAVAAGVKLIILTYQDVSNAFTVDTGLPVGDINSLISGTHAELAEVIEV